MKKEEALNLLDQAVAQLQTNRKIHTQLQQAVMILKEAIKDKSKLTKKN